jgi:hypothetical protein
MDPRHPQRKNHVQHQHPTVAKYQWNHRYNDGRNAHNGVIKQIQTVEHHTACDNQPHNQRIAEIHRTVKETGFRLIRHLTNRATVVGLSEFGTKNTVLEHLAFATFGTFASNKGHNTLTFIFHISVCACIGKKIHPQCQSKHRA